MHSSVVLFMCVCSPFFFFLNNLSSCGFVVMIKLRC